MKKVLCFVLVTVCCFSLLACRNSESQVDNEVVVKYVEDHGDKLVESMENSFSKSSGFTCVTTLKAVGSGFVFDLKIRELSNVSMAQKQQLQKACDAMSPSFDAKLKEIRTKLPELTCITINLCDKDGNFLAQIYVE